MKIKVHIFKDGRQSFSTENMEVEINSQLPKEVYVLDIGTEEVNQILKHPIKYKFDLKNKKLNKK